MGFQWIGWVSSAFNFAVCVTNFHFLKNMTLYIGEKFFRSETPRGRGRGRGEIECPNLIVSTPSPRHFLLCPAAAEYGSIPEEFRKN